MLLDNVGFVPFRHAIKTVGKYSISKKSNLSVYLVYFGIVGKPIPVPKLEEGQTEPTKEQVLKVQKLYIDELEKIYEKYKDVYAADRKQDLYIAD